MEIQIPLERTGCFVPLNNSTSNHSPDLGNRLPDTDLERKTAPIKNSQYPKFIPIVRVLPRLPKRSRLLRLHTKICKDEGENTGINGSCLHLSSIPSQLRVLVAASRNMGFFDAIIVSPICDGHAESRPSIPDLVVNIRSVQAPCFYFYFATIEPCRYSHLS